MRDRKAVGKSSDDRRRDPHQRVKDATLQMGADRLVIDAESKNRGLHTIERDSNAFLLNVVPGRDTRVGSAVANGDANERCTVGGDNDAPERRIRTICKLAADNNIVVGYECLRSTQ